MIVSVEPGGSLYFFGRNPPKGLGIGGRIDVPIKWGFGVAAGYQSAFINSATTPLVAHHPYLSLVYRIDDLPIVIPWAELGGGMLFLAHTKTPLVQALFAGHIGAGLDFGISHFIVGFGLRYHAYLETQSFPSGMSLWLRLGFRFLE
jgi:hypothetical protein